ncbi:hypothetical protein C4546_03520 [Candidatus Parcubacteria bacterium]|jgi:hypothetical protein|nr:MAG: hypothetical protein C4546_03520 [Candidatus Parcubacteria bacterium]
MGEKLLYLLTAFNLILYLYIAFQVSKKWRWGKAHRRFLFVILLSFLWIFIVTILFPIVQDSKDQLYHILTRADFIVALFIGGFMTSFSIHFPDENKKLNLKNEILLFVPLILLSIFCLTDLIISFSNQGQRNFAPAYYLYLFVLVFYFLFLSLKNLLKKFILSHGIIHLQIQYLLIGYTFAVIILLVESVYVNLIGEIPRTIDIIILNSSALFSGFAAFSMLKFRFLEISLVLKRGVIRLLSFAIIFGIYLFIILLLRDTVTLVKPETELTYLVIITLLVVLTVEPIRKLVYKKIDKIFETHDEKQKKVKILTQAIFTSTKNYEGLLNSIIEVLKKLTGVEQIRFAESTDAYFSSHKSTLESLRATGLVLIPEELPYRLDDDPRYPEALKELRGEETSLFLPMGRAETFMGSFIFGKRKNHAAYAIQEIKELEVLQYKFGEAMFNVRLYKQAVGRIKL